MLHLCTPVYSTEAMRAADRATMEDFGLPGFTLMETAARGALRAIEGRYGPMRRKNVLVLAGKGNNGGDGLAIARLLLGKRARVLVVTTATEENATEDAAHNLRLLRRLLAGDGDRLTLVTVAEDLDDGELDRQIRDWGQPDVCVDALLGIGIEGELREPVKTLAHWTCSWHPVVAVDVPTGVNSDSGNEEDESAVVADLTVTMGRPKVGLLFGDGRVHAGEVVTVDIGIPEHVEAEAMRHDGCAYVPTDAYVRSVLPKRAFDAHKYEAGMALVVAGADGYTGAAVMAATAAARVGAGYIVCATTPNAQRALDAQAPPVATLALPTTDAGTLHADALDALLERAEKAKALLVGPGLGRDASTQRLVHRLLLRLADDFPDLPVVLDADALTALAEADDVVWKSARHYAAPRWVLTPHAGEFRRLVAGTGGDPDALDALSSAPGRRTWLAADYARRWNAVLLLKGAPSVVGQPDGPTFVDAAVHAALATAGAGDVLAGTIAGLLAQGCAPAEAAVCALHLGGACAERYAATRAPRAMQATDLVAALPHVLAERFE